MSKSENNLCFVFRTIEKQIRVMRNELVFFPLCLLCYEQNILHLNYRSKVTDNFVGRAIA